MGDPARRRATYQDLANVPAHLVAEIIGGILHTHPRPAPRHARASSTLGVHLGRSFDQGDGGPGGWWILDEPELHLLTDEVIVPDLAGWRVERMSSLPESAYFTLAPDWICEVLSPSTEADDRAEKMPVYAAAGVSHVWLVDPIVQTLEVFRRDGEKWLLETTFKADAHIRAEPFNAVELDLGSLRRGPVTR